MRTMPPCLGASLCILALTWTAAVKAQDARPFEDVKPDHWAYELVTDLQAKGVIQGYPDHHFSGQRTLTRYEFAVAVKRALDGLPRDGGATKGDLAHTGSKGEPGKLGPVGTPEMGAAEVDELKRLTANFKDELGALGMDTKEIQSKLEVLSKSAVGASHRIDRKVEFKGDFLIGGGASRSRYGFLNSLGSNPGLFDRITTPRDFHLPPATDLPDGIRLRSFANGTETFGNDGAQAAALYGANLALPAGVFGGETNLTVGRYGMATNLGGLMFGGAAPGQMFGIHGGIPLFNSGELGVTLLDFSTSRDGIRGGIGLGSSAIGSVSVYGASVRLNPFGRFAISGEAAKSVTQRIFDAGDGANNEDNNAFLLNLGYNSGPLNATAGYQYYDPRYAAPGFWNKIGSWYNPTNVQGPFTRLGYRFSDKVNADLGVDYLTGARNRPGFTGFTQGSSVIRGLAGVRYHFSKQFEISANYEGVLYDMSGAISASGLRAKPVEQYITFGAGLNLTGNAVLRLAYQIINVQDPGNGFGVAPAFGGSSPGGTSTGSVFTTQLAVHF